MFTSTHVVQKVRSNSTTWTVDDNGPADFAAIQEALNSSSVVDGDIINVRSGKYREQVFVNKSVSLVGQDPDTTVVDGSARGGVVFNILNTVNVRLENFTVQNTTDVGGAYGLQLYRTSNTTIRNVIVTNAYYGLVINNSSQCRVLDSQTVENYNAGIVFLGGSSNNTLVGNRISRNPTGIYIESNSLYNRFYRNNIVNNTLRQANLFPPTYTRWNNGVEGNYWSDYTGEDVDGDGIGDTDLPWAGVDNCPLFEPWSPIRTYGASPDQVIIRCNYTVASFAFNSSLKQVSFYITGPAGWSGFCDVTIPQGLLSPVPPEEWIVIVGKSAVPYLNESVGDVTRLSFNYTLGASMQSNRVRIRAGVFYPPTADFELAPDPASTIEAVNFTDTSTNSSNGEILWREWDFGDGQVVYNETFVSHWFLTKALFNVTLTVGDNNSQTDSITRRVLVRNLSPAASFTLSPLIPAVGVEVEFNASESRDPDGSILEYCWSFGDNNVGNTTSPTITHKFGHSDTYLVTLTVIDDDAAEDTVAQIIPVGKGATHIHVNEPTPVKAAERFTINATLLDESNTPVAFKQITINIYNDDLDISRNFTTDQVGLATTTLALNTSGEYVVKASYLGSLDYVASESTIALTVDPIPTSLDLQPPESTTQNHETTFFATLLDENGNPIYNATVQFHRYNGSTWVLLSTSQTNQSGTASLNHTSTQVGTFTLKASYDGDGKYAASISGEHDLIVAAPEVDYVLYVLLGAIVTCVAIVLLIFLRRKK